MLHPEELRATYSDPMTRVVDGKPPLDFWPYFEGIPLAHFSGLDCSEGVVEWVYKDASGRYMQVLVNSDRPNKFMLIVLDLFENKVHGHHLLDLDKEYGLET